MAAERAKHMSLIYLQLFLGLVFFSCIAFSKTVVTTLPGFDGDLPFHLETGYIGVGESNESQLFYYFVESQRSPALDPLMLWLTGGPGCSVLSAFFYESGPVAFDYSNYNGSLPSLHLNPFAWTQGINIIYVDAPIGTGFSYSTTQENYYVDDIKSAAQTYEFLQKWLFDHPQYLTNQLFIGGDSYSGIPLPIVVQNILDGNEAGVPPTMNLKGYILGNPKTDDFIDENSVVPFVHRLTLISNELYKSTKEDCGGDYVNINASNTDCVSDINTIDELILQINLMQVLEPICQTAKPRARGLRRIGGRRSLNEEDLESISISKLNSAYWCREYNYVLSGVWANDKSVRDALQVRENTTGVWKRCNASLAYTKDVSSTVDYHRNLSKQSLRALIYSGDHDLSVPHIGTENWIHSLDLTTNEYWRPWFVDGQVAGYTEKYMNGDFTLIYATVKGAGHVAPEYKPKECYSMIDRFLAYFPL
ncbi:serine carboxypeptidase-like 18 [Hevea brasiliensis]|nr:serine carboxypeptidase-like 18 [Hevea brasiliensis]